jgi:Tetratricopeptide repeat
LQLIANLWRICSPIASSRRHVLNATHRRGETDPLYRRALAIDEASSGPDHPNVATRLNNLAALLEETHRLGEAERLYRRGLAIDEKGLGPHHTNVAIRLNDLGHRLQSTANSASAMRRS